MASLPTRRPFSAQAPRPSTVARVERNNPVTRNDVIRARGHFQLKDYRGSTVASEWPRARGHPSAVRQKAWVDHFSCLASASKLMDPRTYDMANDLAHGTGWFYRDVFTSAAHNKLVRQNGALRVTTPTCYVERTSVEALAANISEEVTFESERWNNNQFWTVGTTPKRVIVRAGGLYLIGARGNFNNQASDGSRAISIRVNGSQTVSTVRNQDIANQDIILETSTIWPFDPDDYFEVQVVSTIATDLNNCQAWAVAITPEAVI